MKNLALTILFVSTCHLIAGVAFDDRQLVEHRLEQTTEWANASEYFSSASEVNEDIYEQNVRNEFKENNSNASFMPFYFVRKVELCSRSSLDEEQHA